MFEHLRQSWRALVDGTLPPEERRVVVAQMKETLVHARVSVGAMREGLAEVRAQLEREEKELATCRRRKQLALGIANAETVAVAERFERLHVDRVAVLTRKRDAQEAELALAEREVAEMTAELRLAAAGVNPDAATRRDATSAHSAQAADMDAEMRLAALKRRMGK